MSKDDAVILLMYPISLLSSLFLSPTKIPNLTLRTMQSSEEYQKSIRNAQKGACISQSSLISIQACVTETCTGYLTHQCLIRKRRTDCHFCSSMIAETYSMHNMQIRRKDADMANPVLKLQKVTQRRTSGSFGAKVLCKEFEIGQRFLQFLCIAITLSSPCFYKSLSRKREGITQGELQSKAD